MATLNNVIANANGNVGIGTTNPTAKLTIVDNTNGGTINLVGRTSDDTAAINFRANGDASTYAYVAPDTNEFRLYHNDGFMSFYPGGSEKVRITSTGNIGIGTTTPTGTYGKLSVAGGIRILDDNNAKLEIGRYSSGASNSYIKLGSNSNSLRIANNADSVDIFTIENGGNVGIGTTSPITKLHVTGNIAVNTTNLGTWSSHNVVRISSIMGLWSDATADGVASNAYYNNNWYRLTTGDAVNYQQRTGDGTGNHIFQVAGYGTANSAITWTDALTILNGGNVGIGTTSPTANLTVYNSSTPTIDLNTGASTSRGRISATSSDLTIAALTSSPLVFKIDTSEKVRIASDGNVGIGTTSPSQKLHIVGTAYSDTDFRAPIFYDSNDPTYYLDPASTTLSLKTRGYINITNASAPQSLAMLNIGYNGNGETRAIDIYGGWGGGESKSITFNHGTTSADIVAQINAQHNGPGSKLRFGKLYHSGNSSTYTMELVSESATSAYLTVAGSVGIGTTNPTTKLAVSDGTTIAQVNPYSGVAYFGTVNNYPMALSVNSSEKVRITSTGCVGIGTTSVRSNSLLDVYGAGVFGTSGYGFYVGTDATGAFLDAGTQLIRMFAGQTERIRIQSDGNIGIGTTSPAYKLDVSTSITSRSNISTPRFSSAGGYVYGLTNSPSWNQSCGTYTNNNATAPDGTTSAGTYTLNSTCASYDLYQTITGITVGRVYTIGMWVKLGTATNFCLVVNNTISWNSIGGKAFTSSDGLSTGKWTHISYTFTQPAGSNQINIHLGYHLETGVTQQTAGTVFLWNIEMTEFSSTWIGNVEDEIRLPGSSIWTSRGNVGIGTTSPGNKLEVKGADDAAITAIFQSTAGGNAAYNGGIQLGNAASSQNSQIYHNSSGDNTLTFVSNYGSGTGNKFIFSPGGTERVRFQQNGNVGIGTSSPIASLHIKPTSLGANGFILERYASAAKLIYAYESAADGYLEVRNGSDQIVSKISGYASTATYFQSNVGIGTSVPGAKLQINDGDIWLNGASSASNPEIRFIDDSGISIAGAKIRYNNSDGNLYIEHIYNSDASGIFFKNRTAGTSLNTLSLVNGNVGIGITTPIAPLDVQCNTGGTGIIIRGRTDNSTALRFYANNGTTQQLYIGTDDSNIDFNSVSTRPIRFFVNALLQYQISQLGVFSWKDGAGGDRMTLNSTGLGIGTTSPANKLEVVSATANNGSPFAGCFFSGDDSSASWRCAVNLQHNANTTIAIGSSVGLSFAPLSSTSSNFYGSAAIKAVRPNTTANNQDTDLAFWTRTGASNNTVDTEKLRITGTGNVGIGTTSPGTLLNVHGATPFVRINTTATADHGIKISYGNSDTHGLHLLYNANSAVSYIDNTYPVLSTFVYGDIYFRQNVAGTMTTRMTIKADGGNVGIGTTSPGYKLDVNGDGRFIGSVAIITDASSGDSSLILHRYGGVNKVFSGYSAAQALFGGETGIPTRIQAGGQYVLTALTNGNVGIGTTSPSARLHVFDSNESPATGNLLVKSTGGNASIRIDSNSINYYTYFTLSQGGVGKIEMGIVPTSSDFYINPTVQSGANGAAIYIKKADGNVGIGTTSPTYKLDVRGNVLIGDNTTNTVRIGSYSSESFIFSTSAIPLTFYVNGSEKMRIASDGNVGIGTTSALGKLHVYGLLRVGGAANEQTGIIALGNDTNPVGTYGDNGMFRGGIGTLGSANYTNISSYQGIVFNVQNAGFGSQATRMIIDVNGNVCIGTTTPVSNCRLTLQSSNTARFAITDGTTTANIWPTGGNLYISTETASDLILITNANERMRILSGGNVGIGTTSPTAKLHVVGSSVLSNNATINPDSYTGVVAGGISDGTGWGVTGIGLNGGATGRTLGIGNSGSDFYFGAGNGSSAASLQTYIQFNGPNRHVYLVPVSGNVGIGTTSPTQKLDVNGTVLATAFSGPLTGNVTGNATNVTGTVAIANGGTGATSAAAARTNLGIANNYLYAKRTTNQTISTGTWANRDIIFNINSASSGIAYDTATGVASLTGGKVYRITALLSWSRTSAFSAVWSLFNNADNSQLGPDVYNDSVTYTINEFVNPTLDMILAPTSSIDVKIRTTSNMSVYDSSLYVQGTNVCLIIQQIA